MDGSKEVVSTYPLQDGWWSPAARRLHLALVIGLPGCMAAGWFELTRALGGREIAWVYAGEWPLYGVLGTYLWWKLLHSDSAKIPALKSTHSHPLAGADESLNLADPPPDLALEAWQSYLTRLNELDPPGGPPGRNERQQPFATVSEEAAHPLPPQGTASSGS